jgi:hypothetical protein
LVLKRCYGQTGTPTFRDKRTNGTNGDTHLSRRPVTAAGDKRRDRRQTGTPTLSRACGKSDLKRIVSMLTRLIQRTHTVAEDSGEYEYRVAEYEYENP